MESHGEDLVKSEAWRGVILAGQQLTHNHPLSSLKEHLGLTQSSFWNVLTGMKAEWSAGHIVYLKKTAIIEKGCQSKGVYREI